MNKLPKGWHYGSEKPRAKSKVYRTSRVGCVKGNTVLGWGYARWVKKKWEGFEGWGSHYSCKDFIWSVGSPK